MYSSGPGPIAGCCSRIVRGPCQRYPTNLEVEMAILLVLCKEPATRSVETSVKFETGSNALSA